MLFVISLQEAHQLHKVTHPVFQETEFYQILVVNKLTFNDYVESLRHTL